jgi:energy-coupling factor transport system substrate-specific component
LEEDIVKGSALGIIETNGRAGLIEAVDSALKTAAVTLQASYCVGGGLNTVTLIGDVAAIQAAMDAAQAVITKMNIEGTTHVIARLADEVWRFLEDDAMQIGQQSNTVSQQETKAPPKIVPTPAQTVSQTQKVESEPPKSVLTQTANQPQADKVNFNVNTKIAKYKAKNKKNRRRR